MIIAKEFLFEAAHTLPNEPCYGSCSKLHGHTYKLIVEVEGKINDKGWVMNFKDLKDIVKAEVIDKFDHSYLNSFISVPTAENILIWIYERLKPHFNAEIQLKSLTLYETRSSYARLNC